MKSHGQKLPTLSYISDAAPNNTGINNGSIRKIEEWLGVALMHIICLLHFIELPARHLLESFDGSSKSPEATRSPIGQALEDFELTDFVNFRRIGTKIPDELDRKLFKDKQDLLRILDFCRGISKGSIPDKYLKKIPQKMHSARYFF